MPTYSSNSQQIKHTATILPSVHVPILRQTFIVKAVHLRNLPALVIAPQQGNFIRVFGFQRQQSRERLQTVIASVHEISHENIIRVGHLASLSKQFFEIVKLRQKRFNMFDWNAETVLVRGCLRKLLRVCKPAARWIPLTRFRWLCRTVSWVCFLVGTCIGARFLSSCLCRLPFRSREQRTPILLVTYKL